MIETERRFIIKKFDLSLVSELASFTSSSITQTYLNSEDGVTERVRMRRYSDRTEYTHTKKIRISYISAIEDERQIDEEEYLSLIKRKKEGTRSLEKTRYTFSCSSQLFEVDVYPEWRGNCILETEIPTQDTPVNIPPFIEVLREVTGDRSYSNASMSRSFPPEIE